MLVHVDTAVLVLVLEYWYDSAGTSTDTAMPILVLENWYYSASTSTDTAVLVLALVLEYWYYSAGTSRYCSAGTGTTIAGTYQCQFQSEKNRHL